MKMAAPAMRRGFIDNFASPEDWYMEVDEDLFDISYLRSTTVWNRQPPRRPRQGIPEYGPETYNRANEYLCEPYKKDPKFILTTLTTIRSFRDARALGYHIPHKTAEIICQLVFTAVAVTDDWMCLFYNAFFPAYLEREHSWASVHLLKRAFSARPEPFRKTFAKHLIASVRIPKYVLQDFVINLTIDKRDYLMRSIPRVDLTAEAFVHNLPTINALFVESVKVDSTCDCVASLLQTYGSHCYSNRDYGRLLLTLLTTNGLSGFNQRTLKELIESHCSEFRGPCMAAMDEIIGRFVEIEYQRTMRDSFDKSDQAKDINRAV
ncbi:uncharacterized protein LOC135085448 [Ostrinia nubilalis]|uniref:uncharacterized protein LOC135085445 n=1 Tax=Ostrinia nubilalis TaxID=29057 RepID=UPI003082607F